MDGTPYLETRELRKEYGEVVGLAALTVSVYPGEIVGLLGANGAGKTTALRMMAAVLTPTAGTAQVCGCDVRTAPVEARRHLGFLSGAAALYRRLTPRENIEYFGRLHGLPKGALRQRTETLIEQFDMKDFADRPAASLSSGESQRVHVARTLIHDPPVLILDEPTRALDVVSARFILERIKAARAEGKAVLFSTHQMDEAEFLCDRLVLLHKGRVRASGTVADLRQRSGGDSLVEVFLHFAANEEGVKI